MGGTRGAARIAALLLIVLVLAAGGLAVAPARSQTNEQISESRRLFGEGLKAKAEHDYATYRARVEAALALRPYHMELIYKRAGAAILNGDTATALADLRRVTESGLGYPVERDPDFGRLAGHPEFIRITHRFKRNLEPLGKSLRAFTAGPADFWPEGIAYDPRTKSYFLSGVHRRAILRRDARGVVTEFVPSGRNGLWSAMGLALDDSRRELWVGSAALREAADMDTLDFGRSALFRYDLKSGKLKQRYDLSARDGEHLLGDITLGPDGNVYASDASAGLVWRWNRAADSLEVLVDKNVLSSPQGLVFGADPGKLYLADYARGPMLIDLASNQVSRVVAPENAALLGIDGLLRHGTSLLAIQNGTTPRRILQLDLAPDGRAITRVRVLDSGHPEAIEPTHGVVAGDTLYYVANSLWGVYEAGRLPPLARLPAPLVLKIPLASPAK